jgi:zinc protease
LDRPDLTQSEIRLGHLGLPRPHADYFPLTLVNYALGGGGFSSRLMTRIRSEMGATYGIRSAFHFRRAPGPFTVSTFTPAPQTAEVVREIRAVLQDVQQRGVTAEELAEAQSYYVGHFPLGLETSGSIARQVIPLDLYGLGRDYLERYPDNIRAVTLAGARQAAQTHLHPESLVVVVVGPAQECAEELAKLGSVHLIREN